MLLLVFGGGMHSTDDFQIIKRTFYALVLSLVKNFMKIRSVVIKNIRVIIPLSVGGGLCSMNDCQIVKEVSYGKIDL